MRKAEHAESRKDFIHKMAIALKETNESNYWIQMLKAGEYVSQKEFDSINSDCEEIIKILAAIVKSSKA